MSAIKRAQQLASSQTPPAVALGDEEGVHTDGEPFPYVAWELADGKQEIIERFPDVEIITPKEKDVDFLCALDAKKLYELARAICGDGSRSPATMICLHQNPSSTANTILVRHHRASAGTNMDNYGLIMPVAAPACTGRREEYRRTMPHPREVLDTLIDLFRLELQNSYGVRLTVWRGDEFLASGQADRLEDAAIEAARKVLDVLRAGATEMPFADAVAAEHVLKRALRAV